MELRLEVAEASLVYKVLRNRRDELRHEVRHATDSEGREYIKHKVRLLNRVLERFPELDLSAHMRSKYLD